MTDESSLEQRIRERAHGIWLDEGQPHGRDKAHWEAARMAIVAEDRKKQREAAEDRKKQSEQRDNERGERRECCQQPSPFAPPFVFWPWTWWR